MALDDLDPAGVNPDLYAGVTRVLGVVVDGRLPLFGPKDELVTDPASDAFAEGLQQELSLLGSDA